MSCRPFLQTMLAFINFILICMHTCQELVHDTIRSTACISNRATARLGNGVQLVEENDAGCCCTSLVEYVSNVALRFTEPHRKQFGTLDGDEVGRTLVCHSLCQHSLTRTRRTIEEHT